MFFELWRRKLLLKCTLCIVVCCQGNANLSLRPAIILCVSSLWKRGREGRGGREGGKGGEGEKGGGREGGEGGREGGREGGKGGREGGREEGSGEEQRKKREGRRNNERKAVSEQGVQADLGAVLTHRSGGGEDGEISRKGESCWCVWVSWRGGGGCG